MIMEVSTSESCNYETHRKDFLKHHRTSAHVKIKYHFNKCDQQEATKNGLTKHQQLKHK